MNNSSDKRRRRKSRHTLFWILFLEIAVVAGGLIFVLLRVQQHWIDELSQIADEEEMTISYEEPETEARVPVVPRPDIDVQLLTVNKWSRPGDKVKSVDYIVIHYLGNPETSAQQNHDYFESLKDLRDTQMSANYIVGLEGEIIQCVPDDEVAYASNEANNYSISIENCHHTENGKFTKETYNSLVKLTAYLADTYDLDRDHIIRHYDVTGKQCPLYFVQHEDKWEAFLDDVTAYREKCEEEARLAAEAQTEGVDELTAFMEENAKNNP